MRVLVLGAGVIGLTSAYYLVQQGHQVTVVDRQLKPASPMLEKFLRAMHRLGLRRAFRSKRCAG